MSARAIVVSPDPANDTGGTERLCGYVARLLERRGFDVALVGPAGRGPRWIDRNGGSTLWQAGSARRAAQEVGAADLVVTFGWLGWPGRAGGRRVHVYVGNLVRLAPYQAGHWHWRLRWGAAAGLAEALSARGATVVAVSEQAAEDARRLYRARVAAILPLGVDTEMFRPHDRDEARRRFGLDLAARYALFVGRPEPGKGPDVAADACRRAGFVLLHAGGALSQEDLALAYAAVDATVLPTRYEGFGYVAVESLACGTPIVTTPTGWARELARDVPAYRPWLVPPEPDAVAAALTAVQDAPVEVARERVLASHTLAAFEARWAEVLAS